MLVSTNSETVISLLASSDAPSSMVQLTWIMWRGYRKATFLHLSAATMPQKRLEFAPVDPDQLMTPEFFNYVNFAMKYIRIHPSEQDLFTRFAHIGVFPCQFPPPGTKQNIVNAIQKGIENGSWRTWLNTTQLAITPRVFVTELMDHWPSTSRVIARGAQRLLPIGSLLHAHLVLDLPALAWWWGSTGQQRRPSQSPIFLLVWGRQSLIQNCRNVYSWQLATVSVCTFWLQQLHMHIV